MRIPIFTDQPGWHGTQLLQAFARRGVEAKFVSLQNCVIDLSQAKPTIAIPGFDELPTAVFVRGISGGTLQQVITRLNILHMLTKLGVRVYNKPHAIERTVDKAMASFLLRMHGVSTPATWICESRLQLESICHSAVATHHQLVIKPLFGSQGQGVRKLLKDEVLPVPMQQFVDGVYYLQQFIDTAHRPHDYRLFVVAGRVIAAMKRQGETWVCNVASGGHCEAFEPTSEMEQLAINAAKAVDIDYCGVDIIQAVDGEYFVLEVNSIPAWHGLQTVTEFNIAEVLVDDLMISI